MIIHLLDEGLALCGFGFLKPASDWPQEHRWVPIGNASEVLPEMVCKPCAQTSKRPKNAHFRAAARLRLMAAAAERVAEDLARDVKLARALADELEAPNAPPIETFAARGTALFRGMR